MHYMVDPRQKLLFDPYQDQLPANIYERLCEGWEGVMRFVLLELMPVDVLANKRHASFGRPTKELYSVAGLLFLKDYQNWTVAQAAEQYNLHAGTRFALNLPPLGTSICERTIENYQVFFVEDDAGAEVFERVTAALADALEIRLDKQRGDSTHIFSNMALFGRTRMMGVSVKRFLTQLMRHDRAAYDALEQPLRERYAPSANRLFADTARGKERHRLLRQQVAEDMYALIQRFEHDAEHHTRTTYRAMVRVFFEQCEVKEQRVRVKPKTGGRVTQNTSDPDATYDGKKGPGYQAQLTQTCSEDNPVQLITGVVPQTAADSDAESLADMLDTLDDHGRLPDELLLDAAYGSDENVQAAKAEGVDVISPVNSAKRAPEKLHAEDFTIDPETEEVRACPAGHAPLDSTHEPEAKKTTTHMDPKDCAQCPYQAICPTRGTRIRTFTHTPGERRRGERRHAEQDPAWRKRYAKRAGIEGLMSCLKRCTGLDRLRVRGQPAVFTAIYHKAAGWNLRQAAKAPAMRAIIAERRAQATGRVQGVRNRLENALRRLLSPQDTLRLAILHGFSQA